MISENTVYPLTITRKYYEESGFQKNQADRIRQLEAKLADVLRKNVELEQLLKSLGIKPGNKDVSLIIEITFRERRVIKYIVQGLTNKEVAAALGISTQVVKNYLRSIYRKTGTKRRSALTGLVLRSPSFLEAGNTAAER